VKANAVYFFSDFAQGNLFRQFTVTSRVPLKSFFFEVRSATILMTFSSKPSLRTPRFRFLSTPNPFVYFVLHKNSTST